MLVKQGTGAVRNWHQLIVGKGFEKKVKNIDQKVGKG